MGRSHVIWLAAGVCCCLGGCGGGPGDATDGGGTDVIDGAGADGARGANREYSTEFGSSEDPLSEGGAWSHTGLDWNRVVSSGGIAYGTQTGTGGYDDSYALLGGFPPDHGGTAVVHRSATIDGSCSHEVEILLRWSDGDHTAQGYECNVSFNGGYTEIVRWNGPLGDFDYLDQSSAPGLADGDTFEATVVGNVITIYVNGEQRARAEDDTYTGGNPGIGFFRRDCGTNEDFALTSFSAFSVP